MLSEEVVRLAARLAELLPAPLEKAIILNTGSEANEIAMRIAKLATGRFEIVSLDQGFHGLTAGAASVTHSVGHHGYGPQLPGTFVIPEIDLALSIIDDSLAAVVGGDRPRQPLASGSALAAG
jgi:2,2-dialkylglycine decarboxylase (pyruvate)